MATVSGIALANSTFPVIGIGAGASARAPSVRDTSGIVGASVTAGIANQNGASQQSAFSVRDTGIDGQNAVRLAGDNGALLDLPTSISAQEASTETEEAPDPDGLSEAEEEQIAELKRADAEVRRHEAAHAAAGGAFAGAPSFTFERGPDGQLYAVAGEVSIDAVPVEGDPEATIQKLQIVRSAALAPADPSAQDQAVAAQAQAGIRQAQSELQAQRAEELAGDGEEDVGAIEGGGNNDVTEATGPNNVNEPAGQEPFSGSNDRNSGNRAITAAIAQIIDIAV